MTMRLDIVTNDAGELVRREHARELGASVVIAIYRLAKLAQLHDLTNQAFLRQLEQTHQIIGEYCLRAGTNVNILFAHKAVFVAAQLLKGSRSAYDAATELGEMLDRLGGSELFIQRDVTREELLALAEQVSIGFRSAGGTFRSPSPKIRLRAVSDSARLRGLELESLSPEQRTIRMYASAVVVMRRFFEDLQASRYILPRRLKRIAQSLVDLSEGSTPAFLGVTEVRNANFDEAGRAVNTAILAVAMAREVTHDRPTLSQIAMAAMMHDVARPRALALAAAGGPAMPGMQGPSALSEDQEDRLAAGAAAVLTALGRVNEPSIARTVLAFEALWIRRRAWLGPVYWGARPATLHAKIIGIARRYNDLLTPEPGLAPPTPDYAVAQLADELTEPQDRVALRMLVSALGLLPLGTVVQLDTGEVAEVIRGAKGAGDKPRIRIATDAHGAPLPQPLEIELAQDPRRHVTRVVAVDGWRKGLELNPRLEGGADDGGYVSESDAPPPMPAGDSFAPWAAPEPRPPARRAGVSSVPPGEPSSSASVPSMGSSPSAVGEAMGRVLEGSARPPALSARDADRTLFEPHAAHDAALSAAAPSPHEPTARGDLATTPLPHVLVYMLDHGLTGSVVFEGTHGHDTVVFMGGAPTKVRLASGFALFGEVLVDAGVLDQATVDAAVSGAQQRGLLLGEHLVRERVISRETIAWALEAQLLHRIAHLANLPTDVTYAYFRDVDLLEGVRGGEVSLTSALSPILASVRSWRDRARVRATLSRIGRHPLVLHQEAELASLAVTDAEAAALDAIRAHGVTLAELGRLGVADEEAVASLVYALAVTRQLAFKGQKKGPMAPRSAAASPEARAPGAGAPGPDAAGAASAPVPPSPAAPAAAPHASPSRGALPASARSPSGAAPVAGRAASPAAPVPAAGARPGAPAARPSGAAAAARPGAPQIRPITGRRPTAVGLQPAAPLEARATSSPLRAPAPQDASPGRGTEPDDEMQTIAFAPSEARKLASRSNASPSGAGARRGARPSPGLPSRAGSPSVEVRAESDPAAGGVGDAEAALEAMTSFRLAEAALQRNDTSSALQLAEKAVRGDPSQSDYVALLAWVRALGGGAAAMEEAIVTMSRLLSEEPSSERARLYRARLYARTSRVELARADFDELLASNPHHLEAANELRLLKGRSG